MRMNRLVVRQAAAGLVDHPRWPRGIGQGPPAGGRPRRPSPPWRTSRPTTRQRLAAPATAWFVRPGRADTGAVRCGTSALTRGHGHRQPNFRRQRLQGVPGRRRGADRAARRRPHRRRHRRRGGPPRPHAPALPGRPRRDHRGVSRRGDPLRVDGRGPSRSCTRRSAVSARGHARRLRARRLRRSDAGRRPGPSGPRLPRPAVPEPGGAGVHARRLRAHDADLVLAQDPDADRLGGRGQLARWHSPQPARQPAQPAAGWARQRATRSACCWPITCCATARAPTGWWWRPWCRPGWSSAWPRRPACTMRRR